MKLNKLDLKIFYYLDYNARIPLSDLAKKVNLSKQTLSYRLQRLKKENIITHFVSVINLHELGYLTFRTYFRYTNVNNNKEQKVVDFFKEHNHVIWFVRTFGQWDLEVVFTARNIIHFNNILKEIKEEFNDSFSKYDISTSIVNYHFPRDYLLNKKRGLFKQVLYGFEPKQNKIDALDINILIELSKNCRQSNQEIGTKYNTSYHTIKNRIKIMEKKGIIQSHRIHINIPKIGRNYFKINFALNNHSKEEEEKLYAFCSQFNSIVYLVESIGNWQFELEAEVKDQEEIQEILRQIRNEFPKLIQDYSVLQVLSEEKLDYFPIGKKLLMDQI